MGRGQGVGRLDSDELARSPQGGGDRAAPLGAPAPQLRADTLPSKWIFLLRWMSSSVLFMVCTLALHSCTSCGDSGGHPQHP